MSDGPGLRVSLFVSGCTHNCPGCFNSSAFDFSSGTEFTKLEINRILKYLDDPFISGLSILGGDPLMESNYRDVLELVKIVRDRQPSKSIWVWTGYKMSFVKKHRNEILFYVDAIVDGKYNKNLPSVPFRGSSNQKIWYNSFGEFVEVPEEQVSRLV